MIVSRRFAYHGTNAYGTSLAGIPAVRDGFGPLVRDVAEVAHDDPDELARTLDELGERAAGFIGEPVIGAGGVIPPPDGYWPAVERICRERDVLLIADEVICGFGRLGRWFGCERYGFTPDLLTCAKGISSGYVPLGAVVASRARPRAVLGRRRRAVPPRRHLRGPPGRLRRGARRTSTSSSASGWSSASPSSSPCSHGLLEPFARAAAASPRSAVQGSLPPSSSTPSSLAADPALVWTTVLAARAHGVLTRVPARRRAPDLAAVRRHRGRARRDGRADLGWAPGRRRSLTRRLRRPYGICHHQGQGTRAKEGTWASVSDILDTKGTAVLEIDGGATVFDAVTMMVEGNVGSLLVTEDGRLAGIVTERDYLRRVAIVGRDERTTPVREIMSAPIVYTTPESTIEECMAVMTERRIRHLPVLDGARETSPASSRSATS